MKRIVGLSFVICISIVSAVHAKSAYECDVVYPAKGGSAAKLFEAKKIVWVGIDFRQLKCVGPEKGFIDPSFTDDPDKDKNIRMYNFKLWNEQIRTNDSIHVLERIFQSKEVKTDIAAMMEINRKSTGKIWSLEDQSWGVSIDVIKSMISSYKTTEKDGVGMAVVAKKFDKSEIRAYFTLVFFDLATKELILAADYMTKPMWGVSVYTWWFDSIKYALKKTDGEYEDWADDYK